MSKPTNIDELVQMMEEALPVGIGTLMSLAVTGEPYFSHAYMTRDLTGKGYKDIVEALWNDFAAQLENWPPGKAVLYWRMKPEYDEEERYVLDGDEVCKVNGAWLYWNRNQSVRDIDEDDIVLEHRARVYMRYLVSATAPQIPHPISPLPVTPRGAKEEGCEVEFID